MRVEAIRWSAAVAALGLAGVAVAGGELWNNGGLITNPGAGAGGANVSAIGEGQTLFGWGIQGALPNTLADDFVVSPEGWNVSGLEFFTYQTGSTTTSTITGLFARIWSGTPGAGGSVIWGDLTTNLLTATDWTGIYRTTATDLTNIARPIMSARATGLDITLAGGTYWVEWTSTGSLASGPWQPPVSSPDGPVIGNALQFTTAGGFLPAFTAGTELQGALPFVITGSVIPAPGAIALLGMAGLLSGRRRR
jgi:hypothetical protein